MKRFHFYTYASVVLGTALALACSSGDNTKTGGGGRGGSGATGGGTATNGGSSNGGAGNGGGANGGSGNGGTKGDASVGGADAAMGGADASVGGSPAGGSGAMGGTASTDAAVDGITTVDGAKPPPADSGTCAKSGDPCSVPSDCCVKICNPLGKCGSSSVPTCTADNQACSQNSDCCSKQCGTGGTCKPVSLACRTLGNPCTGDSQCCSKLCGGGQCQESSYCTQPGDICTSDSACCSGLCNIAGGASVGTCALQPPGSASCTGVDGVVCGTCGDCCSRSCAPGPTGTFICQPASGCHVTGDICATTADCCGGDKNSGLPGAGNVTCQKQAGNPVGICNNGVACTPQGAVCHYKNYSCSSSSAPANCCSAVGASGRCVKGTDGILRCNGFDESVCNGLTEGSKCSLCQLDTLGIPRCNGLGACRQPGETCSSAADCCNDLPCIPGPTGELICGQTQCQACGGNCTINADCCVGGACVTQPGSTQGTCECAPPPPDAGTGGAGGTTGSGGAPGTGGATTPPCALYGQACSVSSDCCSGVPCDPVKKTCVFPGG